MPNVNGVLAAQAKPTIGTAGNTIFERGTLYGEKIQSILTGKSHQLADEGSYYVIGNATPGTAIAGHAAATTYDQTKPLLYINNGSSTKRIYLDYIRLFLTNAGTAGTNVRLDFEIDDIARRTSGGTAITPQCPNMDFTTASAATVYFGAVVSPAAGSNVRRVGTSIHRSVIGVVGDSYTMTFGSPVSGVKALITSGTAIAHTVIEHCPIILGPGDSLCMIQWSASQSGAYQFEFEAGFWER